MKVILNFIKAWLFYHLFLVVIISFTHWEFRTLSDFNTWEDKWRFFYFIFGVFIAGIAAHMVHLKHDR